METRASQKRKQRAAVEKNELKERNPIDTISSYLPDDVLERVFSFLPIESLAQTIILSKHWRDLCQWRSHPHLDFSLLSSDPHPDDKPENLARTVLHRRQHDSDINTFRLSGRNNLSLLQWHHYPKWYFQSWDDDRCWISRSQNLIKSIKRHLKVAKIDVADTKMSKSAVYLVKFLLRHETALQELSLTLKSDPSDPPLVREIIRSQIMKFAQPSSNVIISFLPQGQSPQ
ncbi:hypothetical protein RHMOL_Rhmol06G0216700 [Rhododendron molle]|uniref:Uncharacterized protein n=1 Tax=Rhododendron molle TaxID=49168 RepID=A0ACC0NF10_RHOML|nr:hypothetical protein RHMOL_Rhmol06G0216700 [Rhododendron molle]